MALLLYYCNNIDISFVSVFVLITRRSCRECSSCRMKMDPAAACVLQTLLVLMTFRHVASVSCPRPCSCPQPTELHCTFRSLITVPAAVSKNVERMNLGSVPGFDSAYLLL